MKWSAFLRRAEVIPPAAVFQVSYANGLGIIRDLARHDIPVVALDAAAGAIGLHSRHATGLVCPDPRVDEEGFIAYLEQLGPRLPRRAVVFPTHDEYIWPLSRHAERLSPWFIVPFSGWETMRRLHDKREQIEAAWRCGVDTPRTAFIDSPADVDRAGREVPYPALLKPVDSLAFKRRFGKPVVDISDPGHLARVYPQVDDVGTLMLQERVPGNDDELYTVGSYVDAGSRPLAVFTGHKLRQYPRGAGSCCLGVSKWDTHLADAGLRLLRELGYHGVTQVEFKRDARDGKYRLMEVNARHWMWHSLAAACGVNLSLAAYRDALGRPFLAPRQVDDVRWVVLNKDLPLALREVVKRERDPIALLRSYRGVRRDGVHSLTDPVPGLIDGSRVARRAFERVVLRRPSARADI